MSRIRMIVRPLLVPELCSFDYFFGHFSQKSCTPHNSVTIWDIFIKPYRNVYQVKTMCRVQIRLLALSSFQSYGPLIVFYAYFV